MTARIIQFPGSKPDKMGYRRARRRSRVNLEDFGQLNLFSQSDKTRIVNFLEEVRPFEHALYLEEEGDTEGAMKFYEKAVQQGDHREDAYCNIGIILTEQGRTSEALNAFTLALGSSPRHLEAHYNLANLYADAGNRNLASIHYDMAIQIDPSFAGAYYNLALLYVEAGDLRKAEEKLMQFRAIAPEEEKSTTAALLNEIRNHLNIQSYE